jgi:hypothetical protein
MRPEDTTYFVMAMRLSGDNDEDQEIDFIIGDDCYVIEAVERCNMLELTNAELKVKKAFPKHKTMITHLPLFEMFETLSTLQDLEKEVAESGEIFHYNSDGSRLRDAFYWENKHNPVINNGKC